MQANDVEVSMLISPCTHTPSDLCHAILDYLWLLYRGPITLLEPLMVLMDAIVCLLIMHFLKKTFFVFLFFTFCDFNGSSPTSPLHQLHEQPLKKFFYNEKSQQQQKG